MLISSKFHKEKIVYILLQGKSHSHILYWKRLKNIERILILNSPVIDIAARNLIYNL